MKIWVFSMRPVKRVFSVIKWTAVILLFSVVAIFLSDLYMRSEAYVCAMIELRTEKLVIVDAGHGGEDPGTVGCDGTYEKDLNLLVAKEVGEILQSRGYAVIYTRTEDKLLYTDAENIKGIRKISDLKNRCKIAAEYPNSIFLSIHMNSYSNPVCEGLQVYFSQKNEESKALAKSIQETVCRDLQPENGRLPKSGKGLYLLENSENPAVIVECGFISNPDECKKLSEKEYRKQLSLSIVCGIIEYKEKNSE